MRRNRITLEELATAAPRENGIGSLDSVRWAVLETNGPISFLRKGDA